MLSRLREPRHDEADLDRQAGAGEMKIKHGSHVLRLGDPLACLNICRRFE